MQIFKYGVCLNILKEKDLEMVRDWRNSDLVRPYMQFTKKITYQEQLNWFQALNKKNNLYFIIEFKKIKIGLINIKNIDWENGIGEAGIFIGNVDFVNSLVPVLATISLMDYAFEILKLKKLNAKIAAGNHKVIEFNKKLGYQLMNAEEQKEFNYYYVTKAAYLSAVKPFKVSLEKLK